MNTEKLTSMSVALIASVVLTACNTTQPQAPSAPAASGASGSTAAPASGSVQINGSGATFPQPLYENWAFAYNKVDPAVKINYSGGGSGQGKKDILAGTVDFAGSDATLTDAEFAKKPLQHIPVVAGAVVLAYNVKGVTAPLVLDGPTIGSIFAGKIEKWNDAAIAKLNPGVTLPDTVINVVHRSDGSGTTNIFTLYLTAVSDVWKGAVNPSNGTTVDWPVDKLKRGQGGKGNQGVAAAVHQTQGAIGYVELAYAQNNKIPFAKLINAAGKTVDASPAATTAAMKDAQFSDRLTSDIENSKQPEAWPIAGFTYLLVNKDYADCDKATKLLQWIQWGLTNADAQNSASQLLYAPLPADVSGKAIAALKAITCKASPVLK